MKFCVVNSIFISSIGLFNIKFYIGQVECSRADNTDEIFTWRR